ncbi:MAG: nucleotidyltransferase domain-containing protein [Holosporaceae bacterium]|jgi:predicted nucleotidyltransferase|nr:nucleotidyltransferase domain-containing protein [Holosporaceae bacterium]
MIIKGVSEKQLEIIKDVLQPYSQEYNFFMYGSRVNGNFSKNSDLDILIKGQTEASWDVIEKIQEKFDESDLPFIVHFADSYNLDENFYKSIKNSLVKI